MSKILNFLGILGVILVGAVFWLGYGFLWSIAIEYYLEILVVSVSFSLIGAVVVWIANSFK